MTTATRKSGQVAKILNSREIIINRGTEDGVETGMLFAILDRNPSEISDPETGELLGVIRRPQARVEVTRVEARLSFARTLSRRVNVGGVGRDWARLSQIFEPPQYELRHEPLRTDEPMWDDQGDRYIRPGDPIEQVFDSEYAGRPGPTIQPASSETSEERDS